MAKRPTTAKALIKELDGHITASKATLSVNFNGSTVPLLLPAAGIVSGEDFGILKIGATSYVLELDRKGTSKTLKVIEPDAAKVAAIAKQLLPEPEEAPEVKAAREALEAFAVPKGYKLVLDSKGKPKLEAVDGGGSTGVGNGRSGGTRAPKNFGEKYPSVGDKLRNTKDGNTYTVVSVNKNDHGSEPNRVVFEDADGNKKSEGISGPFFSKYVKD